MKYFSKKFFVTCAVLVLGFAGPIVFVKAGVDANTTLAFMALIASVGVAYGVVQGKLDAAAKKDEAPK